MLAVVVLLIVDDRLRVITRCFRRLNHCPDGLIYFKFTESFDFDRRVIFSDVNDLNLKHVSDFIYS